MFLYVFLKYILIIVISRTQLQSILYEYKPGNTVQAHTVIHNSALYKKIACYCYSDMFVLQTICDCIKSELPRYFVRNTIFESIEKIKNNIQ